MSTRRRGLRLPADQRDSGGLSPASRIRIAADVSSNRHQDTSDDDSGCILDEYTWTPNGLRPDMVHTYFAGLPEDKVPYVNSVGDRWRQRQLRYQLPPQDSDVRYCGRLSGTEAEELRAFENARKAQCLGRGEVLRTPYDGRCRGCAGCHEYMDEGEMAVYVSRTDRYYHPCCFSCHHCEALLVDLIYFTHENKVFCGRHHAEQLKPRCAKCDELIFSEECTEAEGRSWHIEHFTCVGCGSSLGGRRYLPHGSQFICVPCHSSLSTSTSSQLDVSCQACGEVIPDHEPLISQSDLQWHATDACFHCIQCRTSLLGKPFALRGTHRTQLHCVPPCHGQRPSTSREQIRERPGKMRRRRSSLSSLSTERKRDDGSSCLPAPPRRAPPPPPPSEGIYETVLAHGSASPPIEKRPYADPKIHPINVYSRTPNQLRRTDSEPLYDGPLYGTSSDSSDDDDLFYATSLLAAASIASRRTRPSTKAKVAKKRKQNRCIVS